MNDEELLKKLLSGRLKEKKLRMIKKMCRSQNYDCWECIFDKPAYWYCAARNLKIDQQGRIPDGWEFKKKPEKKKKTVYVKSVEEILTLAAEEGAGIYKINHEVLIGFKGLDFVCNMLQYCGKPKPNKYSWLPKWLEEREV